jgi:hypothetical protein
MNEVRCQLEDSRLCVVIGLEVTRFGTLLGGLLVGIWFRRRSSRALMEPV